MPQVVIDLQSAEDRRDVEHRAVQALAEGGVVATRVVWHPESQVVWDWIRQGPEHIRWRRPELAAELLPTIREELPRLNEIRRQVIEGVVRGADHSSRNVVEITEEEVR